MAVLPPPESFTHIMSALWPGARINSTPGAISCIAIEQPPLSRFFHRSKVLRHVAGAVALAGSVRVFEFLALHHVAGVRGNVGHGAPIHPRACSSRSDRNADACSPRCRRCSGRTPCSAKLFRQPRQTFERVNVAPLVVPFVAARRFPPESSCRRCGSAANSWPSGSGCARRAARRAPTSDAESRQTSRRRPDGRCRRSECGIPDRPVSSSIAAQPRLQMPARAAISRTAV